MTHAYTLDPAADHQMATAPCLHGPMRMTLEPTGFDASYAVPHEGKPPPGEIATTQGLGWRVRSPWRDHVRLKTGEELKDFVGSIHVEVGDFIEMAGRQCAGLIREWDKRTFAVDLRVSPEAFSRLLGFAREGKFPVVAIYLAEGAWMESDMVGRIEWDTTQRRWVEVVGWDFQFALKPSSDVEVDAAKLPPTAGQIEALQKRLDALAGHVGCLTWLSTIGVALLGLLLWTLRG